MYIQDSKLNVPVLNVIVLKKARLNWGSRLKVKKLKVKKEK